MISVSTVVGSLSWERPQATGMAKKKKEKKKKIEALPQLMARSKNKARQQTERVWQSSRNKSKKIQKKEESEQQ